MGRKLYDEAVQGNKVSLLNLLLEDALLLDRFISSCYPGIPLQVAIMLVISTSLMKFSLKSQRTRFSKVINTCINYKKLKFYPPLKNFSGFAPEVNLDMCLVCDLDGGLCLVCDLDGRNPLHIAAMKELIHARPWVAQLLMRKNYDPNNIFHIAIAAKQIEVCSDPRALNWDVSCEKEDGFTAVYLLSQIQRDVKEEIVESFGRMGATHAKDKSFGRMGATHAKDKPLSNGQLKAIRTKILLSTCDQSNSIPKPKKRKDGKRLVKSNADWLERKCDTLMSVASLLAAMAYQWGVNPPSVVWQYNSTDNKID
ncbi:hypothetical protein J1N35_035417 [Gossypium stocksii]|uniref:PGG domain-containing protein n=1 Tax=Gossypium stocksii TaxID=47602 RepID=A0A9D3ZRG8_9ROSI|nr:hypothetical protein J1N35_035417 [Gossypium stocksii]